MFDAKDLPIRRSLRPDGRETFKEFFERTQGSWNPLPGTLINAHLNRLAEATAAWNDKLAAEQEEKLARIERAVFPLG